MYARTDSCKLSFALHSSPGNILEFHALEWLKHPNPAVGGDTPLEHAGTPAGAEEVIDLIGRLEHGIPS